MADLLCESLYKPNFQWSTNVNECGFRISYEMGLNQKAIGIS